jgi:hypothetical protein
LKFIVFLDLFRKDDWRNCNVKRQRQFPKNITTQMKKFDFVIQVVLVALCLLVIVHSVSPARRNSNRKYYPVSNKNSGAHTLVASAETPQTTVTNYAPTVTGNETTQVYHFDNCPDSLNQKINDIAASCDKQYEIVKIIKLLPSSGDGVTTPGSPLAPNTLCTVRGAVCVCNPNVRKPVTCTAQLTVPVDFTTEDGCLTQKCECAPRAVKSADGTCVCALDRQTYDPTTNSCKNRCDDSEVWRNGKCIQKCESNKIYNYTTRRCENRCKLTEGKKWDDTQKACVSVCNYDQSWDVPKQECVNKCQKGESYDRNQDKCFSICKVDERYDQDNDRCIPRCPTDKLWSVERQTCVDKCSTDEVYQDSVCNKKCPNNQVWNNDIRQCQDRCDPDEGLQWNEGTSQCVTVCASGTVWKVNKCVNICKDGEAYQNGQCVSKCGEFEVFANGACVCNEQSGSVCSTDGKTFVSKCALIRAKATFKHAGVCTPDEGSCGANDLATRKCLPSCPKCQDNAYTLRQQFTADGCADECLCINKERKCITQDVEVASDSTATVLNRVCCTKIKSYDSVTVEEFKPVKACSQTKCTTTTVPVTAALQALFL